VALVRKLHGWRAPLAVLVLAAVAIPGVTLALAANNAPDASLPGSGPAPIPVAEEPPLPPPRPHVVEPQAGVTADQQPAVDPAQLEGTPSAPREIPPSDKEARAELAQLEALQLGSFTDRAAQGGWHQSIASVYSDYGLGLACGGLLGRTQLGVAHKTAPCGTLVTFRYNGRTITVPVIDRGPYIAGREWDLTGAAAAALGFPGLGTIEWSTQTR
jgi:rare lipoprotein A (peptidoglycan hydrolase)